MFRYVTFFYSICITAFALAQPQFPENGPVNPKPIVYALTGATVYTNYQTKVEGATLIISKEKVVAVGKNLPIPKGAVVLDMKGRIIYPAFIDLYSSFGVNPKNDKKGGEESNRFISSKAVSPFGWNEAIKAEMDASALFQYDDKQAELLRKMGFAAVLTGNQDGICRGSAALVHTANLRPHQVMIKPQAAAGFSFNKGSSTQPYPSSLMGTIALIRQTYYDAQWYGIQKEQYNITLDAFNRIKTLPAVFAVRDKLDVLRVSRLAEEFKTSYIVKGTGDEYQRADAIAATKLPLIVPVNYPKPFEIGDRFDAEQISTADLKHWEMAPFNLSILMSKNITCAITADGLDDAKAFFKNIRKAITHGAKEQEVLKALTHTPATLMGVSAQLGNLQAGAFANFIITSKPVFDEQAKLLETWSAGVRYRYATDADELNLSGTYSNQIGSTKLIIENMSVKYVHTSDTLKATIAEKAGVYTATWTDKSNTQLSWVVSKTDSATYPYSANELQLTVLQSGIEPKLMILNKTKNAAADTVKTKQDSIPVLPAVIFPFVDYGMQAYPPQRTIVFRNATLWTNEQQGIMANADIAISSGKITAVGKNLSVKGAEEIDAKDLHITAGIIDEHSHIAIMQGVNEGTQAVTAEVRIGDAINSEDINIYRQLAGGVVAAQLLHGSANPIGGQSALIKLRWGLTPEQMKIEGADGFIKFALGENVKQSNWGDQSTVRFPQTRMGVEQVMMDAFTRARQYEKNKARIKHTDLELEALSEILNRKRFISCHSYVQSEINMLMHVADSFKFRVNTFTHILEGYKVADKMKAHGVHASTFADWWAYKYEVLEAIPYNASILQKMGVVTAINSDDAEMGRRLNQEAAKAVKYGGVTEEEAWKMVTLNPAIMLHLDKRMGSLKAGKDADIVVWNTNPLSIDAMPLMTFVDGRLLFDRSKLQGDVLNIEKERARLIEAMRKAKQSGESTQTGRSRRQIMYHCDTEEEEQYD
jgi:imidazolonepropionase-like amidohydrolase